MRALDPAIVIAEARTWLGTPYRHQASLKHVGCDCLGLVRGVYDIVTGEASEEPPPYSANWASDPGEEVLLDAARRHLIQRHDGQFTIADVLAFRWAAAFPAKHLAIVSGEDSMIHAYDGAAVVETSIGPWWRRRIAGIYSFPGVSRP